MTHNEAAIAQGKRIAAVCADVFSGLNCPYDDAVELVAGVLIGIPESIDALGLAGEYIELDADIDDVEFRLRVLEGKYGGVAATRLKCGVIALIGWPVDGPLSDGRGSDSEVPSG